MGSLLNLPTVPSFCPDVLATSGNELVFDVCLYSFSAAFKLEADWLRAQ